MLSRQVLFCALAFTLTAGEFESAKTRYYAAIDGENKALDEAEELFAKLRETHPQDAVILSYAGSIQLMQASRTMAPWRKGKLAKEGLTQLDDAVTRAPENVEVRFIRAASTYHLPGLFKRAAQSEADFAWLSTRAAAAVASRTLDARLGAAALYHHGLFREKAGDKTGARTAWQEAVRIGGSTRAAADARRRLESGG